MRFAFGSRRSLGKYAGSHAGSRRRQRSNTLERAVVETLEPRLLLSTVSGPDTSALAIPLANQQQAAADILTLPTYYAIKHPRIYSIPAPALPAAATSPLTPRNVGVTPAKSSATASSTTTDNVTSPALNNAVAPAYGHDNFGMDEALGGYYYYVEGSLYVGDDLHSDDWVATDSAGDVPTLYCDASNPGDDAQIFLVSDAAYDNPQIAGSLQWAVYSTMGDLVAYGNFSDTGYGAGIETVNLDAGYYGTQNFIAIMGLDANGNGALDSDEIMLASNIEAVDLHGLTANGQSGGLTLYAGSNGSATVNVNALINPGDSAGDSWIKYWVDPSNASPSSGDFGSGSQNITFAPGTYSVDAGFDWSQEQAVSVTVVAPPMLTSLALSDTHSGGPSITVGTDSGSDSILYLNLPDTGTAGFNIATSVTGTMLSPAVVRWKIDGETATPDSGTNGGTVSADGSSSGNWTYAVTAWVDMNNNGQIDNGESELQGTVRVVEPVFRLMDATMGDFRQDPATNPDDPDNLLPVSKDDANAQLLLSLDDLLSSDALPALYTYEIDGWDDTPLSSGSFDGDVITIATPPAGNYSITVKDTQDANFQRYLRFVVYDFHIVWEGADLTGVGGATEVTNGEILPSDGSINILTGQQVVLGYESGDGQGAITGVNWQLPDNTDFIKNYVVTSTSGSVTQMSAGDFTGATLTTYGIADIPGATVKLNITAELVGIGDVTFQTSTNINFQKPGQSIFNTPGAFQVSGTQSMPLLNSTALYDQMSYSISTGPGAVGTVSYVQLVNYDHTYTDFWENFHELSSGVTPELDTNYPYSTGPGSADYPMEPLGDLRVLVSANDSFQTWLMWTPPGGIPVPIQKFSWSWGATAIIGWSFEGDIYPNPAPGSTTIPVASSNTLLYPTWTAVFKVHLY